MALSGKKGLGLGLAIVKRLSGILDIPIRLKSSLNNGTSFFLELPITDRDRLLQKAEASLSKKGNLSIYVTLLNELPELDGVEISENGRINLELLANVVDDVNLKKIKNSVLRLIPWRKGPFNFFGCEVDTEWNSALKWHRLYNHIEDLQGRLVLDVGSGNGYFAFRMMLEGARAVLCLEPS